MTLLEASAGTGKTFTIAALTTRYVAEANLADRPTPGHHVHPHGDRRTARAGARAAGPTPTTGWCDFLDGRDRAARTTRSCELLAQGRTTRWRRRRDRLGKAIAGLRCGHHRDDARLLPAGPLRPRHGRRRRPRGHAGRGRQRPHGRGGRRPLPAQVRAPGRIALDFIRKDAMEIAGSSSSTTPMRRSCRRCRNTDDLPPSGDASPRRCATRWSTASRRGRSSPTTTC